MRWTPILTLACAVAMAHGDVIISNLSGTTTSGTYIGPSATTVYKAAGFTMGSDSYNLESVIIRVRSSDPAATTDVEIWTGNGAPTSMIAQLSGSAFDADGLYTFTPTTDVTLAANTTYWVYVNNAAPSGNFFWDGSSLPPSGIATSAGFHFNGATSLTTNAYEVNGAVAGDCACIANLTGDCETNTNDFFAFLALYQNQDPAADFSPGGGINTNDFFAYLAAYQADLNNPDCPG